MLKEALAALRVAERPVLIYGAGVRLASATDEARELAHTLGIPVAPTWGARDLFPASDALCIGGFGTHGTRAANFAVQNADWILSVGSRLDSKATGTPRAYFARAAQIFMVDIDPAEIRKFGGTLGRVFTGVQADAKKFLVDMLVETRSAWDRADAGQKEYARPNFGEWRAQCVKWRRLYPVCRPEYEYDEGVNPYTFVKDLSEACQPGEVIVSDTGLALGWLMQGFEFKEDQQFIHAFNQTPMGYGLPAAIGAAFARPGRRVILVNGDGGFMLNIQELALLIKHKLPIKILLFNNGGHAMCRQTQEQWLGGKYYSTSVEGGLAFPDFCDVARAYGLRTRSLGLNRMTSAMLAWVLRGNFPTLLNIHIGAHHRLVPQVPYGKPNEDGNPPLPREELVEQMIVGTVE